jgi:hypothetical protein
MNGAPFGAPRFFLGGLPSPGLIRMAREVSPDRIERSVRKLASFGTRHTLSSQTDPERGIGAARDWLLSEFQRSAATANGRMTVERPARRRM